MKFLKMTKKMLILIDSQAQFDLVSKWGPEVILRCKCRDWPSHSMFGQRGTGVCGICRSRTEMIPYKWSTTDG